MLSQISISSSFCQKDAILMEYFLFKEIACGNTKFETTKYLCDHKNKVKTKYQCKFDENQSTASYDTVPKMLIFYSL